MVLDDEEKPCGVAFFISSSRALTAAHNLQILSFDEDGKVICDDSGHEVFIMLEIATLRNFNNVKVNMKVTKYDDGMLDYAVLDAVDRTFSSPHFAIAPRPMNVVVAGECKLVSFGIGMANELDDFTPMITVETACLNSMAAHRVTYSAVAHRGDSGGALLVKNTGEVIAMHQMAVNQAKRTKLQKDYEKGEDRLSALESAHDSVVSGTSTTSVGLLLASFQFLTM